MNNEREFCEQIHSALKAMIKAMEDGRSESVFAWQMIIIGMVKAAKTLNASESTQIYARAIELESLKFTYKEFF